MNRKIAFLICFQVLLFEFACKESHGTKLVRSNIGLTCLGGLNAVPDSCRTNFEGTVQWHAQNNKSISIESIEGFSASFEVPELFLMGVLSGEPSKIDEIRDLVSRSSEVDKKVLIPGQTSSGSLPNGQYFKITEIKPTAVLKVQCNVAQFEKLNLDRIEYKDMPIEMIPSQKYAEVYRGECAENPLFIAMLFLTSPQLNQNTMNYELGLYMRSLSNGQPILEPVLKTGPQSIKLSKATSYKLEKL